MQDKVDEETATISTSVSPGTQLVRKLVSVLESAEKLPLYIYDIPGAGSGLQVLSRRLRFRLERAPGESSLIDRNGRTLKVRKGSVDDSHPFFFCNKNSNELFNFIYCFVIILWFYFLLIYFLFFLLVDGTTGHS